MNMAVPHFQCIAMTPTHHHMQLVLKCCLKPSLDGGINRKLSCVENSGTEARPLSSLIHCQNTQSKWTSPESVLVLQIILAGVSLRLAKLMSAHLFGWIHASDPKTCICLGWRRTRSNQFLIVHGKRKCLAFFHTKRWRYGDDIVERRCFTGS